MSAIQTETNSENKIKIALLGGAFDPPTNGHFKLAQCALDNKICDEVWFVPCAAHSYNKQMSSSNARLKMCLMATAKDPRLRVFNYEIIHQLNGSSYNFISTLFKDPYFSQEKYYFRMLIGLDNANTFHKWINYKQLLELIPFIVISRKGIERDLSVTWYNTSPHIYIQGNDIPCISSSEIRKTIANLSKNNDELYNEQITFLKQNLDLYVLNYIMSNALYS